MLFWLGQIRFLKSLLKANPIRGPGGLLSWLDLLLLLLLLLWAADLLGRSLHLLLLHLLLLLHWQWAEEHLLHLAHWKTAAHWGAQGGRPTGEQHGRQLL